MVYAYPNVTSVSGLASWSNSVTSGFFWPLILIGFFVILFFAFKSYSTAKAFGAASFLTMILTILMGAIGLVGSKFLIGAIILGAIGLICLYISNHPDYG